MKFVINGNGNRGYAHDGGSVWESNPPETAETASLWV